MDGDERATDGQVTMLQCMWKDGKGGRGGKGGGVVFGINQGGSSFYRFTGEGE